MSPKPEPAPTPAAAPAAGRAPFLDYLAVLVRWRTFLLVNVLAAALLAAGVSFLLPRWYRATASVLPPKQQDLFGNIAGAGSVLRSLTGLGRIGPRQSSYNYFAIFKSRTVNEAVARKFDLVSVYGISDSSMEKTLKELSGNVSFEEATDEYITIEVFDRDPVRAAAIANEYVAQLNQVSIQLATLEARNNKEFVGKRLAEAWSDLRRSEDSLAAYQEKSGVIITPEQQEMLKPVATLYALKAKKEVELSILLRGTTEDNPAVQQLRVELQELNKKLSTYPEVGLQSVRLYRDMMIQQRIVEFLTPVFEQARIDEQKDIPVVLVLDRAVTPERKARPQRMLIVLVVTTLTLLLSVALVYLLEALGRGHAAPSSLERTLARWSRAVAARYRVAPEP